MRLRLSTGLHAEELVTADELDLEPKSQPGRRGRTRRPKVFGTVQDARRELRRFHRDPRALAKFRRALKVHDANDVSRKDDDQVIDALARELVSGRISLVAWTPVPVAMPVPVVRVVEEVRKAATPGPKTTWIAFELVDEADQPVANEEYEVVLPDGAVRRGVLDEKGRAHLDGVKPGRCRFTLVNRDQEAWARA
jgi:hypothetical protein